LVLFFSVNTTFAQTTQGWGASSAGGLAIAAQSAAATSQVIQLEGDLEITYQDFKDGRRSLQYALKRPDGTRVQLHFVKEPPTHLLTGDHVRATGQLEGGNLVLYSGSTSLSKTRTPPSTTTPTTVTAGDATGSMTTSIPVPNTYGAQSTLVMLVNFQDDAIEPYTVADAENMFFGTASSFVSENSYGQTSIAGSVVGWFTIPDSVATCNLSQMATDAQNAAVAAGTNLSTYTRYVYAFPQNNACGFAGASYVGGNPSQSWINGNSLDIHTIDHELGHAFGLWHSHLFDCGTTATIGSNCAVDEYGDILDTMGAVAPWSPHYNAFQKERLGWLNNGASPSIQTVSTSGTYKISTYELGGSGPNALKVLKSTDPTTGAKTWYYLEQRQAIGFDAFLTNGSCEQCYTQNETNGVLFHVGTDGDGNSGDLLDTTPATLSYYWSFDPSLAVGQSFQDSTAGVTFTPTAVSSSGATLQIILAGSSSCTMAKPSVSVSPSQSQLVSSGAAVNFTATIIDNDSSSCAPVTFGLGDALPSGWAGLWSSAALTLTPGTSGAATLTVTSPAGAADGAYSIGVSAADSSASSHSGTATATYVISTAPLSVSLTTNQSSYLPGQTVTVAVIMIYGTTPDAGANVSVTVMPPSGKATTLTGTTGSNGMALLNYRLSRQAPAGTYQVQYGATAKGPGSTATASAPIAASTLFIVQ
jgi:hypothetical protein